MFLGSGLNQIIFIFVGIPLIALAIAIAKIIMENIGWIEPKDPADYPRPSDGHDLGYWENKRREEREEKDMWGSRMKEIDDKYDRWGEQAETLQNNKYEYERKQQEERNERIKEWRKNL